MSTLYLASRFTFRRRRKHHIKHAPFSGRTAHADSPAVRRSDFSCDRKAESSSGLRLAGHPEEAVKNARLILFGDTRSLVAHGELHPAISIRFGSENEFASRRRMLDRVSDQIS